MRRNRLRLFSLLPLVILGLLWQPLYAEETLLSLELPSGQEIEIQRFGSGGRPLLLWLPSERGIRKSHEGHARDLAALGHEVWLADLHDSYFVPVARSSLEKFPLQDVVAIVEAAAREASDGVVLISSQRGAQLALITAREWQLRHPGEARIRGALLMHAYLYAARPGIGQAAEYLPITAATNLPVYLLDTQYSTKSAHISNLAAALGAGGSQVYSQVLKGVQGGYFARDENELSDADRQARQTFAPTISRAVRALTGVKTPTQAVEYARDTTRLSRQTLRGQAVLKPLETPQPAPALALTAYDRSRFDLGANSGRIALINFWATWCTPCVEEIPSLHRLKDSIADPDFDIIAVNVGENRQRIDRFLQRVPIELPLLLDLDYSASRRWNIYVYPSSYLVDRQGIIRYAYLGALEWDSPENQQVIRNLLQQN